MLKTEKNVSSNQILYELFEILDIYFIMADELYQQKLLKA